MQIQRSLRAPLRVASQVENREHRQMREEALCLVWETDEWLSNSSPSCARVEQLRYQGERLVEADLLKLGDDERVLARRHFRDDGEVLQIWQIDEVPQGRQVQVMLNRRQGTLTFLEGC